MNQVSKRSRALDILFPILLFAVFALCAIAVVLFAARVYQHSVEQAEAHYTLDTARSYLSQKIRRNDTPGAVRAGTFAGSDALFISDAEEDGHYETCIYLSGGILRELYRVTGADIDPEAGDQILALTAFSVNEDQDGLIRIRIADEEGREMTFLSSVHSGRAA